MNFCMLSTNCDNLRGKSVKSWLPISYGSKICIYAFSWRLTYTTTSYETARVLVNKETINFNV